MRKRINESKLVVILGGRAGFVYELVWETTSFTPLRLFVLHTHGYDIRVVILLVAHR